MYQFVRRAAPYCTLQLSPYPPGTTTLDVTNARSRFRRAEDGVGNERATNDFEFAE